MTLKQANAAHEAAEVADIAADEALEAARLHKESTHRVLMFAADDVREARRTVRGATLLTI